MIEAIKTLQQAIQYFGDKENCRRFMVFIRWPDGVPTCPYCGATKLTWLERRTCIAATAITQSRSSRSRLAPCSKTRPSASTSGSLPSGCSPIARTVSVQYELAKDIGVTQKSAWFMLHRIRLAMESKSFVKMGSDGGPVEVDEAYVGGAPKNKHLGKRDHQIGKKYLMNPDGSMGGLNPDYKPHSITGRGTRKTPVFGMLDREARQVRAHVIPQVKREVLMDAILDQHRKGIDHL